MLEDVSNEASKSPDDREDGEDRANHVSVVFVHGMGSQRRYEDASILIDRLDAYSANQKRRNQPVGWLSAIRARVEPFRGRAERIIGYIRARFHQDKVPAATVRFYEVYWAPVLAEQRSVWRVVKWLALQLMKPLVTLRSPWRDRQRLRRSTLVMMAEAEAQEKQPEGSADSEELLRAYDAFEGLDAHRQAKDGTFDQFCSFVSQRLAKDPERAARCLERAKKWRAAYVAEEWRTFFLLLTLALTMVILVGVAIASAFLALKWVLGFTPIAAQITQWNLPIAADWPTVAVVLASVVSLVGLTRFLTDYLGDVEVWVTYEETDFRHAARNKVLNETIDVLSHVLCDEACERVVVVAHSLGTSIAHDALLALTRRNRAHDAEQPMDRPVPLRKIEHFITYGSPIDKIERFFESYASQSHRYKRIIEQLRGDLGTEPFSRNRKPHIHWINFWDEGDPISGALQSPASGTRFAQRIDNVHVASFRFPSPGASHGAYLDNKTVVSTLFDIIFNRAKSFETLPVVVGGPRDYASTYVGPGGDRGTRLSYMILAIAIPWLLIIGLIAWLLGAGLMTVAPVGLALLLVIILLVVAIASKMEGQRNPI